MVFHFSSQRGQISKRPLLRQYAITANRNCETRRQARNTPITRKNYAPTPTVRQEWFASPSGARCCTSSRRRSKGMALLLVFRASAHLRRRFGSLSRYFCKVCRWNEIPQEAGEVIVLLCDWGPLWGIFVPDPAGKGTLADGPQSSVAGLTWPWEPRGTLQEWDEAVWPTGCVE